MSQKALIIIDVQNDFCPAGTYPVPHGDEVVEPLNKMIIYAKNHDWLLFASRDWHPVSTIKLEGWTAHCIRGTQGAAFHPDLNLDDNVIVISKGEDLSEKHYSAFNGDEISLKDELQKTDVDEVFIGGLALDYCVKNTALDAVKNGFTTTVLLDASRGIFKRKSEKEILDELRRAGVRLAETSEILNIREAIELEDYLNSHNIPHRFLYYSASVKSAEEAAEEMVIKPEQMVKSLLLKSDKSFALFLILSPDKLDMKKLASIIDNPKMASADEVKDVTGYHIGTVTPFQLKTQTRIFMDPSIFEHSEIGIGSGKRGRELLISPIVLQNAILGEIAQVAELMKT